MNRSEVIRAIQFDSAGGGGDARFPPPSLVAGGETGIHVGPVGEQIGLYF